MGGGDLNSKKSWHPNTMKNQERVWKAEQAAANEKKRIVELQRERAEERDRVQLKDLMVKHNTSSTDDRLAWMYNKPDKKVEQEEYLLGRIIDKSSGQSEKAEQDGIPAVSRRVVGSSMLPAAGGDAQVDLVRKIREDPLLLIKERERAARAALLNNPLQRRKLTELLRKEQDQKTESKEKKKSKQKDKDLDNMLAAKLTALGNKKGMDLATLLNLDGSSSDTSSEDEKSTKKKKKRRHVKEKKKVKKSKKKKEKKYSSSSESDSENERKANSEIKSKIRKSQSTNEKDYRNESRKRKSSEDSDGDVKRKKSRDDKADRGENSGYERKGHISSKDGDRHKSRRRSPEDRHRSRREDDRKRSGLSEEARAAKLAEMAAFGAEREQQRGERVAAQRACDAAPPAPARAPHPALSEARALPASLQARIHSNRHYIQRDKRHMNEHFARR